MSQSEELVVAALEEYCRSQDDAVAILAAAASLGVDPLDYCMHRFGVPAHVVMERAAHWAGLAFSRIIPKTADVPPDAVRLDALAQIRSVREMLYDRQVTYFAPKFEELVRLRPIVAKDVQLRRRLCVVPGATIRASLAAGHSESLMDAARQRLARRWPYASANLDLGRVTRWLFVLAGLVLVLLVGLAPVFDLLLPVTGLLLVVPAIFRIVAVLGKFDVPFRAPPLADADLPVYSVLIPLRNEAHMVPLLRRAMTAIDYPPEKLDIKFVVESSSVQTVGAVTDLLDDARFELVRVPDGRPHTKPKALNYALPFVRGEHVVVYDAEDIPDPDQLRLAAAGFAADPGVDCLQAELLVDNARENLLTGLFTGEYASQFGVLLPAFARWRLPMPLGGTSNHFRVRALREMGGWDAFNVTEDADLGVRLARLRYRTGMLASQTYEEAPVTLDGWMRQRTRWMKGWMQTFIVHNRRPWMLWRDMGWRNFLAFEIHVGSLIVSPLLHTTFLAGLAVTLLLGRQPFGDVGPASLAALGILLLGYGGSFALVVAGLLRLGQRRLLLMQLLLPAYWVLHALATLRAGHQLLRRPHFWGKTTHGLTRLERSFSPTNPLPQLRSRRSLGTSVDATPG